MSADIEKLVGVVTFVCVLGHNKCAPDLHLPIPGTLGLHVKQSVS